MKTLLPVDRLHTIGVVVSDLASAAGRYAEVFGIDRWDVRAFGPARLSATQSRGRPTTPSRFRTAIGTSPGGAVTFELVQPLGGESPFQEFRFTHHQGVSHLHLATLDAAGFAALRAELAGHGIPVAASITVDGQVERHFLDTRAALGGYLVEIQIGSSELPVDEHWDLSGTYARPEGIGPLPIQGVLHFGIVVRDMNATIDRYAQLMGVAEWGVMDWRAEPGLLDAPFFRGENVQHEYYTALAQFQNFGLEIIQPTFGPSHYNREFLDRTGEGIHHMLLAIGDSPGEWDAAIRWLDSIGIPQAMGSDLVHGAASFCYFDTFEDLGGYLVEAVVRRREDAASVMVPEYVVDFSALLAEK